MTRRGDPRLMYEAQKAGLHHRLVDAEQIDDLEASRLIVEWERHAESAGVAKGGNEFWDMGWQWIEGELAARRQPPA
jgi:hypothetical protein